MTAAIVTTFRDVEGKSAALAGAAVADERASGSTAIKLSCPTTGTADGCLLASLSDTAGGLGRGT